MDKMKSLFLSSLLVVLLLSGEWNFRFGIGTKSNHSDKLYG